MEKLTAKEKEKLNYYLSGIKNAIYQASTKDDSDDSVFIAYILLPIELDYNKNKDDEKTIEKRIIKIKSKLFEFVGQYNKK